MLQFSQKFDMLALSFLFSSIIYSISIFFTSRRITPLLTFSFSNLDRNHYKFLFRKGLAFQAFPLGNAILYQGTLLIVQSILGPIAVALYATTRTLVRSINQLMELINQFLWPEFSLLIGSGNLYKSARLHRLGVLLSITLVCICILFLSLTGKSMFSFWTSGKMELPQHILILFLISIPFNALWFTSSVIHMACNNHEGLAARYLIASTLTAVTCAVLSYFIGIEGAAISTLTGDIILIPYVFKRSLQLTGDTWAGFYQGMNIEVNMVHQRINKTLKRLIHTVQ
jgi:O-antigen/teichoic acid export membrane protein